MKSTMKKLAVTWFMLCIMAVLQPGLTAEAETEGDYEYTVLEDGTVQITKYNGTATTLTIPDTLGGKMVTRIADMAFFVEVEVSPGYYEDASTVTTVNFPDTLTHIGGWNFYQLTSIHIPANVTYISSRAFGMDYVESITVDEKNTVYDSRDNCNAIIKEEFDTETNRNEVELIIGCNNSIIPDGVTRISDDAFSACSFESIEIPDTVTEIGYCAFLGSGLTELNLPNSVTTIGECAFMNCKGLTKVVLPDSVEEIWDWAFMGCSNLTGINIPEGVTMIGGEAFADCSNLTNINIPESVTSIGMRAFAGCNKLGDIFVPASVTEIGAGAFVDCSSIVVDADNPVYDSRDNCNAIILKKGKYQYWDEEMSDILISGCKNTTIPSSVDAIGANAFSGCDGLTSIAIPKNVTWIDSGAFSDCDDLTSIVIPKSVSNMGEGVFEGCTNLTDVKLSPNIGWLGEDMFSGCTSLEHITIPEGINQICSRAFEGCNNLTSVKLPSTMTLIGESAFADCTNLRSITLPSGMEEIESYTFKNCSSLSSVKIPGGVIDIYEGAFSGCSGLKSVMFPASVEDIGEDVFEGCPTDMIVYAEPGSYAEQWTKDSAYPLGYVLLEENCKVKVLSSDATSPTVSYTETTDTTATKITVPNQVTIGDVTYKIVEIADNAFSDCTALEEVVLPETLEHIDSNAFAGLTDEEDETGLRVTIPEALEEVSEIGIEKIINIQYIIIYVVDGGKAENYFQNFNYITINVYPPQQPSTEDKTDENKQSDTKVKPESQEPVVGKKYTVKRLIYKVTSSKNVTVVGASKKKITKVTIPAKVKILGKSFKVTAVGKKAFKKYTKLKSVVIGSNVKTIGDEAFMKCTKLKKVTVGKNVKTIGKKAFYGDKRLKTIIFKGTKVTKIGKKALKGVPKAKIKVPKKTSNKVMKRYNKLLNNAR